MKRKLLSAMFTAAALLLLIHTLSAQESVLQEERDFRFAEQLAEKKLYDLAAQQFSRFADLWPTSPRAPEALFRAAESLEALEAWQRAADTYLRLVLAYPEAANADKALFNRGKLLAQLGDPLQSALTLERIRLFMPKSELIPLALVSAAEQFRSAGETRQAYNAATAMLAQYPDSPHRNRALFLLAKLQRDARKPALALQEINRINTSRIETGQDIEITLMHGRLLNDLGRYAKADSVLETLLSVTVASDSLGAAACALVQSLYGRGQYIKAIAIAERALGRTLTNTDANRLRLYLGDCHAALGETAQALHSLAAIQADSLSPAESCKLAFRRGVLQQRAGEPALALPWFSQLLAKPDTLPGLERLQRQALRQQTRIFIELGNPGEALRLLRRQFDTNPNLRDLILLQRAEIERSLLRDPVSARQDYQLLSHFYPASPLVDEAALGVAACQESEGDVAAAIKSYANFIALYPASESIPQARARLLWLRDYAPKEASGRDQVLSRLLLAVGKPGPALDWAEEQIKRDHAFDAGLVLLRGILLRGSLKADEEVRLFCLAGLAHARLAGKLDLEGAHERAKLHADTLMQAAAWLRGHAGGMECGEEIERLAMLAKYRSLTAPLVRAAYADTLLARVPAGDSLEAPLRIGQARDWYRFAVDSSSAHWLNRAVAACSEMARRKDQPELQIEAAFLRSTIYAARQQPDSAIQVLQAALAGGTASPAASEAALKLAARLEEAGRLDEAAARYQEWLSRYYYAGHADSIRSRLCQIHFRQRQFDQARSCMAANDDGALFQDLAPYLEHPREDDLLWLSAQSWLLQQNLPAAITAFQTYLRANPDGRHRSDAMLALADLYLLDGNPEAAVGHLEALMSTAPGDSLYCVALSRTADLYYDRKEYAKAAPLYARLKGTASGDLQRSATAREVLCEYKQQNIARARQLADAFRKTWKDRKAEAQFLYEDGMFCLANKDFKAAEINLKELATRYKDLPDAADGEMGLARMYATLNNAEEALKILTNIPNKYSDPRILALAYINLGEFYYENRQLENCVTAGRKALEFTVQGPEQRRALELLITVFDDLRLWENAVILLRQYIAAYPDREETFNRRVQLGIFLINLKEYDRGIDQLKSLLPLADAESEAEIQYWIAKAYHERGEMTQAIIEYLKVRYTCRPSKLPWGTTALYEAGQTYVKLGNLANARKLFQQIVQEKGMGDQFGRVANERIREIDAMLAQKKG
ncbi:MAG TPA: tetratricopeptide repeat protein [bacterium]|nr:tetratricopeptide repeat protein [bacterium]